MKLKKYIENFEKSLLDEISVGGSVGGFVGTAGQDIDDRFTGPYHPEFGNIGNLLQQIGFNLTVVDSDLITYQYENFMDLVKTLRGMGITNILSKRDKSYLGKKTLEEIGKNYLKKFGDKQNKIGVTFEILYLTGWSPHYSQQKPLKPGSAEHSLSSILSTKK